MSSLPKYYSEKLNNGLEIVAIPMNVGSGVISTDIFYKVGSRNEVMGKSGIAHMLEHMNFKSTKNLKEGEFDKIVKSIGGVDNASTGFDYTHYFIKSSNSYLDKSLELFSEVMENLQLTDEEFQRERKVVYEERLWRTDNNPMGYLFFRLFNNTFIYHPYHWTPIGFKDDILNWSIEDIKEFHNKFYQPKNAILLVTGDIEKNEVFETAKKYFSNIKNSVEIPILHQKEPELDGDKNITIYKESEVEMVAIAYHIPNFNHEDQIKLSALSEFLSSGKSSILQKELIYEKELVAQIYGYNMELIDKGIFLFLAICNPNIKAEKVEKEIKNIIKNYEVSDSMIERIKTNNKMDFITSLESSSDVANLFGEYLTRGDINPLLEYEEKINSIKKEDLMDMKKYFTHSVTVKLKNREEK